MSPRPPARRRTYPPWLRRRFPSCSRKRLRGSKMARLLLLAAIGALAVGLGATTAAASPEQGTRLLASSLSFAVDPLTEELQVDALAASTAPGTKHVGPVPSSSPDS